LKDSRTTFFSNPALFESLLAEGIYCSGMVRINRRGMPEAIKGVRDSWMQINALVTAKSKQNPK
jgi:hypothetical protein